MTDTMKWMNGSKRLRGHEAQSGKCLNAPWLFLTCAMMEPERAAKDYYEAQADWSGFCLCWKENILIGLQRRCADCADRYGLGFWRAVRTQFLVYQSHFEITGEFPTIGCDDPIEYLAMMFWDDGWDDLESVLWTARRYQHRGSIAYFERMAAAIQDCEINDVG